MSSRDPVEELIERQPPGYSLQQAFYSDPRIFAREKQGWLARQWWLLAHISEFPARGSFIVREALGESVIIVRENDQRLRGYFNVCRHRGSRLYHQDGCTSVLSCPYHGWSYKLTGELLSARFLPPQTDRGGLGLHEVKLKVVGGLVFSSLGTAPLQLENFAVDLAPALEFHGVPTARIAARQTYPVRANWKLVLENFRECYHCQSSHPEYCATNAFTKAAADGTPEKVVEWNTEQSGWAAGVRAERGFDVSIHAMGSATAMPYAATRLAIGGGRKTLSQDGKPVAPLMGRMTAYDGGETDFRLGRFAYASGTSDHVLLMSLIPRTIDLTDVVLTWLVDGNSADTDLDIKRLMWMWDTTVKQDVSIIENNADGVSSMAYTPGPYCTLEDETAEFVASYLAQLTR